MPPNTAWSGQNGSCKGLFDRLKTGTPLKKEVKQQDAAAPKEPLYVDVTAAFFGRHRRQAPRIKSPAPHIQAQLHQSRLPTVVPLQQQKVRSPPGELQAPGLSLADDLKAELDRTSALDWPPAPQGSPHPARWTINKTYHERAESFAAEGSHLCSDGSAILNELYETLKGAMADTAVENDRALALVDTQHRKIVKPLSETRLRESSTDESGKATLRQEIHIGEQVESFREHMQTLGAEVDQLWGAWEAAEKEVQRVLASLATSGGDGPVGQAAQAVKARESLARDMQSFEEELENILRESHRKVSVSEKAFSKKINGVMFALLQQYLLGD